MKYLDKTPKIDPSSKIFPGALVIGDVTVGKSVGIWYNAVLRGDMAKITIGDYTNIQDGVIVHTNTDLPTYIGSNVTVGHNAIIHAATVQDGALIGMGSIILDGAIVESEALVAAGCLVPPNKIVKSRTLVVGNPMKEVKTLSEKELEAIKNNKDVYVSLLNDYNIK